jgi:hypothetical protein
MLNDASPGRTFMLASMGLLVLAVFASQIATGAYRNDLASDPDEAAHFTTGVMVFDYCRTSLGSNPVEFAESFYVRYPKVAFGNWPPAFYFVQAGWYFVFGPSTTSALLLTGTIEAVTAVCLFRRLVSFHGLVPSLLATAIYLCLPAVRFYSSVVMADSLLCLFSLLAVFAFADFLTTRRIYHASLFLIWASLAILTKGTALALALFVPLAVVITGQVGVLKSVTFWALGLLVAVVCAPFYLATMFAGLGLHGHSGIGHLLANWVRIHGTDYHFEEFFRIAPATLVLLALTGALGVFARRSGSLKDNRRCLDGKVAIAWIASILVFQAFAPFGSARYLLPLTLPLTMLAVEPLSWWREMPAKRMSFLRFVVPATLASLAVVLTPQRPPRARLSGYAAAADHIPQRDGGSVILVSSDELGEGAVIAETLQRDTSRQDVVLRGSKVLSNSYWNGDGYRLRMETAAELRAYLDAVPVNYLVLDHFGNRAERMRPHHELLRTIVQSAPETFALIGTFPVFWDGAVCGPGIEIYENLSARERYFQTIRLDMTTSQLGKVLELRCSGVDNERSQTAEQ